MLDQLAIGGVMIIPVGSGWGQQITIYKKQSDGTISKEPPLGVRYVPLTDLAKQEEGYNGF